MSRYWSAVTQRLTPYIPGEQPGGGQFIKLNTNENPYGPAPSALAAMRAAVDDTLRRYPDPESTALCAAAAHAYDLDADCVFVGNGSDEVLAFVFQALLQHDAPLCFPDITYSFYPVYCQLYGINYQTIPLHADFSLHPDDFPAACGGIIFPNPNAPTGRALPQAAIASLAAAHPDAVIVIDEAYAAFGADSALPLIGAYANLLVVRTLSKSHGLAGLRVGFAFAQPDLIEALRRVKNSFNSYPLDRIAQAGAQAALQDNAHFETSRERIIASREQLVAALCTLGFTVVPSAANFIFARPPSGDAAHIYAALRARGILVRHFAQPRIAQYLRISIGTPAECTALIAALTELTAQASFAPTSR